MGTKRGVLHCILKRTYQLLLLFNSDNLIYNGMYFTVPRVSEKLEFSSCQYCGKNR